MFASGESWHSRSYKLMSEPVASKRRFRPRLWAALLTLAFAAITIHLGNWQGDRARYKIDQQSILDAATSAPAIAFDQLTADRSPDKGQTLRYRKVALNAELDASQVLFVDNKIQDGKAGYGIVQLARVAQSGVTRNVLIDRGWALANNDRSVLPQIETPSGIVTIVGRVNLPQSRNPGTADNGAQDRRINYVNIEELAKRFGVALEPYVIEQTAGAGFLDTPRALPSANYQKNRAYQVQWYAFAGLAAVIFLVLSFRKESVS
jgi:surfeit locus 1 family protein